ncbi:TPA: O-antigen ligase family protein [Streptococcus pneumoniae]|nr:O-antigen ligase family protein [Streptococcus pneumoniae]
MMKRIYYHLLAIWAWTLPNSYAFIDSLKVFFPNISLQIAGSLLAVVSIVIFITRIYYTRYEVFISLLVCISILIFYSTRFFYSTNVELYQSFFKSFLIRPVPAILVAMLLAKNNHIKGFIKWSEPMMLFYTLTSFLAALSPRNSIITYQSLSYYAMTAYMINVFNIIYKEKILEEQLTYFRFSAWNFIRYFLLLIQAFNALSGGGRGAFILLIIFTGILLIRTAMKFKFLFSFIGGLSAIALVVFFTKGLDLTWLLNMDGGERLLNFFGRPEHISTDNRLLIYDTVWSAIQEKPFLGWGVGSTFLKFNGYSHNIVLDLLHDMGSFGLLIILSAFFASSVILYKLRKIDWKVNLFILMFLEVYVHMSFSGSYLADGRLWFLVIFTYCYYRWKVQEKDEVSNFII